MLNCWEVMECGYGPYSMDGACPAAKAFQFHGVNQGDNGGRVCWAVKHTRCQGKEATDHQECHCENCSFYQQVKSEQGNMFILKPTTVMPMG